MSCAYIDQIYGYAVEALPAAEREVIDAHLATCAECRSELEALQPAVNALVEWPTAVLRPSSSLRTRLAQRIAGETGASVVLPAIDERLPAWREVAPGISCALLAADHDAHRISMLVKLEPGAKYPPHTHAGVEELHLLDGELWIDERKLFPGDYNRGELGESDQRVWSETGCTCVLITSTDDVLR